MLSYKVSWKVLRKVTSKRKTHQKNKLPKDTKGYADSWSKFDKLRGSQMHLHFESFSLINLDDYTTS